MREVWTKAEELKVLCTSGKTGLFRKGSVYICTRTLLTPAHVTVHYGNKKLFGQLKRSGKVFVYAKELYEFEVIE